MIELHAPIDGLVLNYLNVLGDVSDMRQSERQVRDRRRTADRLERAFLFEFLADKDRVDLPLLFEQGDHRRKDATIQRRIKILGSEMLDRLRDQRIVEQDRAKDDAFGLLA